MLICFDDIVPEYRPHSDTRRVSMSWGGEQPGLALVESTVERWRKQER